MTRRAVALSLVAALAGLPARASEPASVLLGALDVESTPGLAADGPILATLELNPTGVDKLASLRAWYPDARAEGAKVTVELARRAPAASGRPAPAQRAASFLVDQDEPAVASFKEAVLALGPRPSADALAELVDGWVERKDLTRGFDTASRVASRRQGDCTEHAVLLAAAARLAGRPARIVLGLALVSVKGELRAFGHAWTELHDGREWRTADGTRLPGVVRYLPLSTVVDEGPGYLMSAWSGLSPIDVRRIVLAPGGAAP